MWNTFRRGAEGPPTQSALGDAGAAYRDPVVLREEARALTRELEASETARRRAEAEVHELARSGGVVAQLEGLLDRSKPSRRSTRLWPVVMALSIAGGCMLTFVWLVRSEGLEFTACSEVGRVFPEETPRAQPTAVVSDHWRDVVGTTSLWSGEVAAVDGPAGVMVGVPCTLRATLVRPSYASDGLANALARVVALHCGGVLLFAVQNQEVTIKEEPGDVSGAYRYAIELDTGDSAAQVARVDTRGEFRVAAISDRMTGYRVSVRFHDEYGPSVAGPPLLSETRERRRSFGSSHLREGNQLDAAGHALAARCVVRVWPTWLAATPEMDPSPNCRVTVRCRGRAKTADMVCTSDEPLRARTVLGDNENGEVDFASGSVRLVDRGEVIRVRLDPVSE
jgi:hypothetical protein